jgi:MFS family permease
MGFSEAFAAIATMVGVATLAVVLTHISWHVLCLYFAIGVFFITFLVTIFVKTQPNHIPEKIKLLPLMKNIYKAATNRTVLITGIYGFFMFSVVNSFNSLWGVAFLTAAYPINNELAATVMSTVFLGLAVGCPINGYFSKRYGHEREAMLFCSAICALCMALILYVKVAIVVLYILFFIVGLMCAIYVQSFALIGQLVQREIQGTAMAVANMLIMSSAPVLQILIGAVLDRNSFGFAHNPDQNFQIALSILPIGMLIAFILSFFINKNLGQESINPLTATDLTSKEYV